MDISTFISHYRNAFGEAAPLPLCFFYSDEPLAEPEKINGCFFKALPPARKGNPVSLSAATIGCGGGKLYTGFSPMPEFVPRFVSEKEHYKQTPEMVRECIERLELLPGTGTFLNFIRIDRLASDVSNIEGLLFFATPDMLSGLCAWAFYDNNAPDAVALPFGSGCSSVIAVAVQENRNKGNRTFVGLTDPSVRPYVGANELSFVIPFHRFKSMCETFRSCCLAGSPAWKKVKARINDSQPSAIFDNP